MRLRAEALRGARGVEATGELGLHAPNHSTICATSARLARSRGRSIERSPASSGVWWSVSGCAELATLRRFGRRTGVSGVARLARRFAWHAARTALAA